MNDHIAAVWVQCDPIKVSHMCIFPSDGTGRIRFTGLDDGKSTLSRCAGSPKTYSLCDLQLL